MRGAHLAMAVAALFATTVPAAAQLYDWPSDFNDEVVRLNYHIERLEETKERAAKVKSQAEMCSILPVLLADYRRIENSLALMIDIANLTGYGRMLTDEPAKLNKVRGFIYRETGKYRQFCGGEPPVVK